MEGRGNRVRDLVEKLGRGELSREEALKILEERGMRYKVSLKEIVGPIVWGILCFPYIPLKLADSWLIDLFARLPTVKFPMSVIYLAAALLILAICMEVYISVFWRIRRGGLHSSENPIILLKEGPYGIVRHPSNLIFVVTCITITVVVSNHLPFTISSMIGNGVLIAWTYWVTLVEEREECLRKWGDEYRQYMKEVPRFNFLKGLWSLRMREESTSS